MPFDEIDSYFRNYDKKTYEVFSQQGAEPSEEDVKLFESRVGYRLPEEFREFAVHPLGGLYMAVREELWPRFRAYDVGPFWSFLYGLMVYSLSPQAPDWLQIGNAWQRMCGVGFPLLVPFLKVVGDPDPYCFTPEQKIVVWSHETTEVEEIDKSCAEVLMFEIRELEKRKQMKLGSRVE